MASARVYQPSIQVNRAVRAWAWVFQLRRLINSHSKLAKLSAMALSPERRPPYPWKVVPILAAVAKGNAGVLTALVGW